MRYLILIPIIFLTSFSEDPVKRVSANRVYKYCIELDIKHPEIVTAQAVLETGWFKCKNCSLNRNNIFGWYYKGAYLEFDNWKESVDYYKRWQDKYYKGIIDYYRFLSCIYQNKRKECISYSKYPDQYNQKLKNIVSKLPINEEN